MSKEIMKRAFESLTREPPTDMVLVPIEWTDEQQQCAQKMLNAMRKAHGRSLSDETMIGAIYDGMTAPYRKIKPAKDQG